MITTLYVASPEVRKKVLYLYNRYHDELSRLAKYRLKNAGYANYEHDANDVLQNAYRKLLKYGDCIHLEQGEKAVKTYLQTVVANEVINLLNSSKPLLDIDDYAEQVVEDDFFERLCVQEEYREVIKILDRLDERYTLTFYYRYQCGMEVAAIADLMEVPPKTVYTRLTRGKKIVNKHFKKGGLR